jgi:hypothetical protein
MMPELWTRDEDGISVAFTEAVDPFILQVAMALETELSAEVFNQGRGAYDIQMSIGGGHRLYFRYLGGWDDGGWQCGTSTRDGAHRWAANADGPEGTPLKAYRALVVKLGAQALEFSSRACRLSKAFNSVLLEE